MTFNKNQSTATWTSFHLSKQSNARANELNKFCKNKAFVSYSPYFSKEHTKKNVKFLQKMVAIMVFQSFKLDSDWIYARTLN